ncbi:hypothetical protein C8J57DRAFT_1495823 [Mycena rebaudengoi]|nr:hypothetical protein C8J57DRAFT_1495823 [Mycena rebaudengoi]
MDPADIPLPAFLDPLLTYLSETLPPPIYSFLLTFLSHSLALGTAIYALFLSLLSTHPLQWDAQTVLPPLIALLTSYLAIISLYRTTSWMLRTSLWFMKWGTLAGALIAASSWLLLQQEGNALAGRGIVAGVGSLVWSLINGEGNNAARGPRTRSQTRRQGKTKSKLRKPKPWDSFDRHQEWQFQENGGGANERDGQVQDIISNIIGKAVNEGGWWEAAKSVIMGDRETEEQEQPRQKRKANSKTR